MLDEQSGYGIVRIFKQKFFSKLFRFIKELSNEVYTIHEEMFYFGCRLKYGGECENDFIY